MTGFAWCADVNSFFMKEHDTLTERIILHGENVHHMHVLRCEKGERLRICDGTGRSYLCSLTALTKGEAVLDIIEELPNEEPAAFITLFQALPKQDKMETVIQKCVELGVSAFVPVQTEFSIGQANDKKVSRWQKISLAAAKQSRRSIIPSVAPVCGFKEALSKMTALDAAFVAYEEERKLSAKEAFQSFGGGSIGIFIGPEGGFSPEEIRLCRQQEIPSFSLGKRILKVDTASMMAVIILLTYREDFI